MNTAKPSIPSNNGGAADDLIEELARLMAEGAQDNSSKAEPADGAKLAGQTPGGQASVIPFGSSGQKTDFSRTGIGKTPAPQLPRSSLPPRKSATIAPGTGGPARLTGAREQTNPSIQAPAPMLKSSPPPKGGGASGLTEPQPATSEVKSELPADPIGDLIRKQSNPDKEIPDTVIGQGAGDKTPAGSERGFVAASRPASKSEKADNLQKADKFRIPPVFGLGGKPSGPTSPAKPEQSVSTAVPAVTNVDKSMGRSDALDEIENLIGNAVRVDFSEEPGTEQAKETQVDTKNPSAMRLDEPRITPAPHAPPEDKVDSAEDAILQAMAAIGKSAHDKRSGRPSDKPSNGDFVDILADEGPKQSTVENDDPVLGPERAEHGKTAGKRASRLFVPLGAGVVLIAAILGGYWVLSSGGNNGEAPVLVADNTPSKQAPPKGQDNISSQPTISSEIAGNSGTNANERLVSRDQSGDLIGNEIRRITTTDNSQSGLANRRVRTVTVRPDGTIISGDNAVAGGEVLPVARPNVPKLPANALDPKLTNTVVAALPRTLTDNNTAGESEASKLSLTTRVNFPATTGIIAPIPRPRPANRAALAAQPLSTSATTANNSGTLDLIAGTTAPSLVQPPAATPAPIAASAVSNPKAWVQMASRRSQDAATQSASSLQAKYASVFGNRKLEVQRIDLGDLGIFYRVLLPAASLNEASSVCSAIKTAGGDCFTRNK